MRCRLWSLILAVMAIAQNTTDVETQPEDWGPDQCDCYLTNGAYYTAYSYWDFRDLAKYAGIPDVVGDEDEAAEAKFTSKYFKQKQWTKFWSIQNWNNYRTGELDYGARFPMVNTANNIYIQHNGDKNPASETFLTMRTNRLEGFQSAAQIESVDRLQYLSVRFLGRMHGSAGACMAMFVYRHAPEITDVQEADMEILTREANDRVHYTNHPSYGVDGGLFPNATRNVTLPNGLTWDTWIEHRMDWMPTRSVWYANGIEMANISFQVPQDPAYMIFNAWGDGGLWTHNMTTGGEAYMQMQWLQMVYNASDTSDDEKRQVDEIPSSPKATSEKRGGLAGYAKRSASENVCRMVCSIDRRGGDGKDSSDPDNIGEGGDGRTNDPGEVTWLWGNSTASRVFLAENSGQGLYILAFWVTSTTSILWLI